jgi:ABC-type uncharacterized transport system auxiliary subunit
MRLHRAYTLFAFCCALCVAGCLTPGAVQLQPQYLLAPAPKVPTAPPSTVTLGVRAFAAARPCQSLQMAWHRPEEARIAYHAEGQWAEMPAATVTRAITDALAETARFADVGNAAELIRPDWLLTGELRRFYEMRAGDARMAEIELRLELRTARDKALLWAETLRAETPMNAATPQALAEAMQAALASIAERAATAIASVPVP